MDQHPIPQDVTGFQFKLIGTMTVKQFGYVAVGVVMAVILYYMPLDGAWGVLFKVFMIPLLGAGGVVVAFVPIDGRPIDVMTTNFVKAIFSPNQYVYRRKGRKLSFSTITLNKPVATATTDKNPVVPQSAKQQQQNEMNEKEKKLREFLSSSSGHVSNDLDKKESAFLTHLSIPNLPAKAPIAKPVVPNAPKPLLKAAPTAAVAAPALPNATMAPKPATPAPQPVVQKPAVQPAAPQPIAPVQAQPPIQTPTEQQNTALEQKEKQLEAQLQAAQQEEAATKEPTQHATAHQKVEDMQRQIADVHAQKVKLEQELAKLQNQLNVHKNIPPVATATSPAATPAPAVSPVTPPIAAPVQNQPSTQPAPPTQDPSHVRTVPKSVTKKVGLPHVSDTPNVVVGIVKDSRGNILPNMLVEVKDKDDNPIRAFKTNALGQFASATPLSAGTFTIELEDPKGQHKFDIIQINVNNQIMAPIEIISHDAREQLHKELFATT